MTATSDISNKVFIINRSELEGRFDPNFYNLEVRKNKNKIDASINKVVKFREVISEFKGGPMGFHLHTYDYIETGIPLLRIGNLKDIYLSQTDDYTYISKDKHNELKNSKVKEGDLIFSKAGKVGEMSIVPVGFGEANLNQALSRISLNDRVISEYVYLYFKSKLGSTQIKRYGSGRAVQDDLKMSEIEHFKLILPDLKKQQNIIQVFQKSNTQKQQKEAQAKQLLESIDTYLLNELGIELQQKKYAAKDRIFVSTFREVVGLRLDPLYFKNAGRIESDKYENMPLRKILSINKGQSITKEKITEGDYPVIAGGQTSPYNNAIYNFEGNVITISASGAYSGYVWYHNYPIFASDCNVLQSKDESIVNTEFVYFVLKALQSEIYKLQQGAGQPHVYARDIEKFTIPVPPITKQEAILKHIKHIQQQISLLQTQATSILENAKAEVEKMILGD